jgi:hypothetical protein
VLSKLSSDLKVCAGRVTVVVAHSNVVVAHSNKESACSHARVQFAHLFSSMGMVRSPEFRH